MITFFAAIIKVPQITANPVFERTQKICLPNINNFLAKFNKKEEARPFELGRALHRFFPKHGGYE